MQSKKNAIINYIAQIDNTTSSSNEKWQIEEVTKNTIIISLFFGMLPLIGIIMRKELFFAAILLCLIVFECIFCYVKGRWLKNQLQNNKKKAILIYRISGIMTFFIILSMPLLYGIVLIDGTMTEIIRATVIIVIAVMTSIPIGVIKANTCINKMNGKKTKSDLKQPPFWIAMVIASIFIHDLSENGRIFAITVFLCALNFYLFYSTVIPNCMRLYYVNKYDLEDEIPLIFENDEKSNQKII